MKSNLKHRLGGFTLIEILVVVLIIAILMAVALPFYLHSATDAQLKTCRGNMQTIANAVQAQRTQTGAAFAAISSPVSASLPDLATEPICPSNGTYSIVISGTLNDSQGTAVGIPAGGFGVKCSISSHGGFIPGAMSN